MMNAPLSYLTSCDFPELFSFNYNHIRRPRRFFVLTIVLKSGVYWLAFLFFYLIKKLKKEIVGKILDQTQRRWLGKMT